MSWIADSSYANPLKALSRQRDDNGFCLVRPHASAAPNWIVVANNAVAEFCMQPKKHGRIDKLFTLDNSAARIKKAELLSDRGGRSFDSHGHGRHTLSSRQEPDDVQALKFARIVAQRLLEIEDNEPVAGIALVAAPRFLGMLRKAIEVSGGMSPYLTIDKDVVGRDETFIQQLLAENN